MEIKRNLKPNETTITLTTDEKRHAAAECIHESMLTSAPIMMVKALLDRCHDGVEAIETMFGATLEELLHRDYLNRYVVIPTITEMSFDTSLNSTMRAVIEQELDTLMMRKQNALHNRLFEDGLFIVDDDSNDAFMHQLAANAVKISKPIESIVQHQAAEAGTDVDTFCAETYGASLTDLMDPNNEHYIINFAAELGIMSDQRGADLTPENIARIALNLLRHNDADDSELMSELREQTGTIIGFMGILSELTNVTPDGLCEELFGCSFVEAMDPMTPMYLLYMPESDDDEDDNDECESLVEFLFDVIFEHARDDADPGLLDTVIYALGVLAGYDDDEDEDEDDDRELCFEDGCCPICGLPIAHECGDDDDGMPCECDGDCDNCGIDDYPADNLCPICGRPLDEFPADEDDNPDQMSLY